MLLSKVLEEIVNASQIRISYIICVYYIDNVVFNMNK